MQWWVLYTSSLEFVSPALPVPAVNGRNVRQHGALTPYKPRWVRILAVAAALSTLAAGTVNYTQAGRVMQVQLGYFNTEVFKQEQQVVEEASTFVKRWYDRYKLTGDVADM